MSQARTHADRLKAIAHYAEGHSLRETGKKFGVCLETVRHWILEHRPELIRRPFQGMAMSPRGRLDLERRG